MTLVALGVVWGGYLLGWYGIATLKQDPKTGVGLLDLIKPSQIGKVQDAVKAWGSFAPNVPIPNNNSQSPNPGPVDPKTGKAAPYDPGGAFSQKPA
jgi:hypothetical protein